MLYNMPMNILKTSRPRFWIYLLGPFIIGTVSTLEGFINNPLNLLLLSVYLILFSLPANLFIYGINDIYDFETDILNPKKMGYESILSKNNHNKISWLISLIFLVPVIISIPFLNQASSVMLAIFIATGAIYSIPPLKAKSKPFFDSFISGLIYIIPGYFSFAVITNQYPPITIFLSTLFWSMAMHAFSAIPDIESDRESKLPTVAVMLGKNTTAYFCILLYSASAILATYYIGIISIILLLPYLFICYFVTKKRYQEKVMDLYKMFPILNTLTGFILFVFILLQKI